MPTEVIGRIGTGESAGGGYETFADWRAATDGIDLSPTGTDTIQVALLTATHNESALGDVRLQGNATGSTTNYRVVRAETPFVPDGIGGGTGIVLAERRVRLEEAGARVEGLGITKVTASGGHVEMNGADTVVDGCYFWNGSAAATGSTDAITFGGGVLRPRIWKTIGQRDTGSASLMRHLVRAAGPDYEVIGCLAIGYNSNGIDQTASGTDFRCTDCFAFDNGAQDFDFQGGTNNSVGNCTSGSAIAGVDNDLGGNLASQTRDAHLADVANGDFTAIGGSANTGTDNSSRYTLDRVGNIMNFDGSGWERGALDAGAQPQPPQPGEFRMSQAVADAGMNAIVGQLELGVAAGGGFARALEGATLIGLLPLNEPGFTPASGDGTAALDGPVTDPSAANAGNPDTWAFEDSDNLECFRVTGGDITGDPVSAGQAVELTSYTITHPTRGRT